MGLITIDESLTALNDEVYPEWEGLDEPFQQLHIDKASAYIRNQWTPPEVDTDFDWDDDTTWDDEIPIKALIAQYADADRAGNLYSDGSTGVASTAPIKRSTEKVGSLEITTEYAQSSSSGSEYSLRHVDDQMVILGFAKQVAGNTLVRV